MKIIVTSSGEKPESPVDPRFGRAAKFMVYDTASDQYEAVDNVQNLHAAQGAGIQAAETAARLKADCVLTGHCGPKAFMVLKAAGVKVYTGVEGTVADAVARFKSGELNPAEGADVEGHW
jgi:predicted Fe-Mo cluster-binding NifX family protein